MLSKILLKSTLVFYLFFCGTSFNYNFEERPTGDISGPRATCSLGGFGATTTYILKATNWSNINFKIVGGTIIRADTVRFTNEHSAIHPKLHPAVSPKTATWFINKEAIITVPKTIAVTVMWSTVKSRAVLLTVRGIADATYTTSIAYPAIVNNIIVGSSQPCQMNLANNEYSIRSYQSSIHHSWQLFSEHKGDFLEKKEGNKVMLHISSSTPVGSQLTLSYTGTHICTGMPIYLSKAVVVSSCDKQRFLVVK